MELSEKFVSYHSAHSKDMADFNMINDEDYSICEHFMGLMLFRWYEWFSNQIKHEMND